MAESLRNAKPAAFVVHSREDYDAHMRRRGIEPGDIILFEDPTVEPGHFVVRSMGPRRIEERQNG